MHLCDWGADIDVAWTVYALYWRPFTIIMNHYGATGHVVKFSYKDIITSILLYSQIQKSMLMFLISVYLRSNLRLRSVSLSTLVLLNKWWSPLRLDRRLDHLTQLQVCKLSSYHSARDCIYHISMILPCKISTIKDVFFVMQLWLNSSTLAAVVLHSALNVN